MELGEEGKWLKAVIAPGFSGRDRNPATIFTPLGASISLRAREELALDREREIILRRENWEVISEDRAPERSGRGRKLMNWCKKETS